MKEKMEKAKEFNLEALTKIQPEIGNDDSVFQLANSEFNLPLRIKSFSTVKEYDAFVKNVEKLVRTSSEYRLWVHYITDSLGYSKCEFTKESINECPVVVHHHPIALYYIVKGVLNDMLSKNIEFSTFDVAIKTIELHFQNRVGYVLLLSDLHSKYHAGFLNIPVEIVHGDYRFFLSHYTIEENEYDRIMSLCNIHVEDVKQSWSKDNYPAINELVQQKELALPEKRKLIA